MKTLNQIDNAVDRACRGLLAALFFVMIISAFIQVVARTVLSQPQTWTEELCRYCMVWLTMIGSGVAIKTRGHIAVDILKEVISPKAAARIDVLNMILECIFSVILIHFGFALSMKNMSQMTPGLKIPMGAAYFSMPIGGIIILFNVLVQMVRYFTGEKEASK
jgi:TRAP-type C4-dicarboxylate transport system permease small subunit